MKSVRTEAFLSIIAIAMAFLSGALVLHVRNAPPPNLSAPALQAELQNFVAATSPFAAIKPDALSEFIDPKSQLPTYTQFPYAEVQALQSCKTTKVKYSPALQKAWAWHHYKCGQGTLDKNFFITPPFFHPSGASYAFLYKKNEAWVKANLSFFHILEMKDLGLKELPAPYNILAPLEWEVLHQLANGESPVLSLDYVFVLKEAGYGVFKRDVWNEFWKKTPFHSQIYREGNICYLKESNLCWQYDFKNSYFSPLLGLLSLAILMTLILFALLAFRIRRRARDEKRLQFALEMLAHEIRTPVANMAFTMENFRSHFDAFPAESQSDLLRLFDHAERLKRVVDVSGRYLSKEIKTGVLTAKFTEVQSLRSFIEHTLDPYLAHIELHIDDDGRSLNTDPYWASIAIKNLVENAVKHGTKPIRVNVWHVQNQWGLDVLDSGTQTFNTQIKGRESQGLGLGFKIINEILPPLYGKLDITFNPTRMSLKFTEPS